MEVIGDSSKIQKLLNDERMLKKKYGTQRAGKIYQRISEMKSADNLTEVSTVPPTRLHKLEGERREQFSLDITGNYRLIIEAYDENDELTTDKKKAVTVAIVEVVDYH